MLHPRDTPWVTIAPESSIGDFTCTDCLYDEALLITVHPTNLDRNDGADISDT